METLTLLLFCGVLTLCVFLDISIVYALLVGLAIFLTYGKLKKHSWNDLLHMVWSGIKTARNILITFILIGMLTALWRAGGVDMVVTHAPPAGVGDLEDPAHRGFEALCRLLDKYQPAWLVHGHVHLRYDGSKEQVREYNGTTLINASERYVLDIPDVPHTQMEHNVLLWKTKHKDPYQTDF